MTKDDPNAQPTLSADPPKPSIDMDDLKQTVRQWVHEFLPGKPTGDQPARPKAGNAEDEMAQRVRDEVKRVLGETEPPKPKSTPTPEQAPGQTQPTQTPKRSRFWE